MSAKVSTSDIIFAGAGLSGLSLAIELLQYPEFSSRQMILIDREKKSNNDRTWSFWATADDELPPTLAHSWDTCWFFGDRGVAIQLQMGPYRYYTIRSSDFYAWAQAKLDSHKNVSRITAAIESIDSEAGLVRTTLGDFQAPVVFNSAFLSLQVLPTANSWYGGPSFSFSNLAVTAGKDYSFLLQHFMGWFIETAQPAFDPSKATLMDFRIDQGGDTRFVYVLPFSERRALIEYTVFSPKILEKSEYNAGLEQYISETLNISEYRLVESEFGVIPMTDYPFQRKADGRVNHIGTAGGSVKASSGYAFKLTRRRLRALAAAWAKNPDSAPPVQILQAKLRNRFYDSVLLHVLRTGSLSGRAVFSNLFYKQPAYNVFKFLDEDTNIAEDLRILNAAPKGPFTLAALRQLPKIFYL